MKAHPLIPLLLLLLNTSAAHAYVCSRVPDADGNETGPSLSWFERSLTYTLHAEGTTDISGDEEFTELRDSFTAWETHSLATNLGCATNLLTTDLQFFESAGLSSSDRVGYDFLNRENNENLVLFRDTIWPHPGQTGIVIALTTNTYNALTGEIFDADIEFNSVSFHFTTRTASTTDTDLMNTAVHEIGHFLGLSHTRTDLATMYERAETGETNKRDLFCDDAEAIEFKYPQGRTNGYCEPPSPGCGYCAPPGALNSIIEIEVTSSDPDSTAGCAAASQPLLWPPLMLLGILYHRRRRRLEVSSNLI